MPGMGGHGLLREILEHWPHIPVIMLTAHGTIPDAVGSIQAGAADYLTKPFDGKELVRRIRAILETAPPDRGAQPCTGEASAVTASLRGGEAPAMARFLSLLQRVARSTAGVLLYGESGTGKELAARILHEASPRADGPFVVVDCGFDPAHPARKRTLRPRQRVVHPCREGQEGSHRGGGRRHAVSGRDRQHLAGDADPAAALFARKGPSAAWGTPASAVWPAAWWRPPTPTCRKRSGPENFGKTSTTGSRWSP